MQDVLISDGARLKVVLLGDSPSKPLIIVHHGAPGVSSHLEPQSSFGFLADEFRVLIYDARGSGDSDLKPPYTHERWVTDLEELRAWAKADQFILAGGSYGGFVSLEYAVRHPSRLLGLILRDTWAYGPAGVKSVLSSILSSGIPLDSERQTRLWNGQARDDKDLEEGVADILPLYPAPSSDSNSAVPLPHSLRANAIFHSATHNAAFSVNVPQYDVRAQLKSISAPTLVTVGRHDIFAPVTFSEEIFEEIPEAELVIFERSGHSPPSEEPEAFQRIVRNFLSSLELDL